MNFYLFFTVRLHFFFRRYYQYYYYFIYIKSSSNFFKIWKMVYRQSTHQTLGEKKIHRHLNWKAEMHRINGCNFSGKFYSLFFYFPRSLESRTKRENFSINNVSINCFLLCGWTFRKKCRKWKTKGGEGKRERGKSKLD